MAKNIQTRIQLKHDSLAAWNASDVILKPGEVGVAYVDVKTTDAKGNIIHVPTALLKVGENVESSTKTFKELPFISALAADVYDWAKKEGIEIETSGSGNVITNITWTNDKLVITKAQVATSSDVLAALADYYTKTEIDNQFALYTKTADLPTDLGDFTNTAGYAKTSEVENKIANHATEVTNTLKNYSTTEQMNAVIKVVDDKFANYSTTEEMNAQIDADVKVVADDLAEYIEANDEALAGVEAKFADYTKTTDLPTDLGQFTNNAGYAKTADVNTELAKKADKTQVATDIAAAVAPLATTEALNTVDKKFENYTTTTDMNAKFNLKADKSVVDAMYTNAKIDELVQGVKDYADNNDADTKYGITYDSDNKKIKLVEGGTSFEIDATDFIKDGMIETVTIGTDNDLVITFNTAAGREDIVLPLDQLVDIYTGTEGARVKVTVASDKSISAELVAGSISKSYLDEGVQASLAKADSALQSHQSLEHLATKEALNGVDAKFANYTTTTAQQAIDAEQNRRLGVIEGDYLKAADIANFETKENVKKVADDLAAYEEANDAALDVVRTNAQKGVDDAAAAQKTIDDYTTAHAGDYTNKQIDDAIDADVKTAIDAEVLRADAKYEEKGVAQGLINALKLGETYEPIGAEARAIAAAEEDASNKVAVALVEAKGYADKVESDAAAAYRRKDVAITSDDLSDEVFIFNCGTSTIVL